MRTKAWRGRLRVAAGVLLLLLAATAATAQDEQGPRFFRKGTMDGTADGMTEAQFKAAFPEYFPVQSSGVARPADVPDIFGPGCVLSVGNLFMKVTNFGVIGNPWAGTLSSDPSGQWRGASGIEYLDYIGLAVGAVNPEATDPNAIRRVSSVTEWRPPSLDPVDKMYRAYDGILNGARFVNDDNDTYPQDYGIYRAGEPRIDEDFLDGIDNDGDGLIDEDYGAIGQQTFTCRMRDDTPQAINAVAAEKHVPLGLEVHQMAWAYSIPGFTDFNVVQYTIYNVSGHPLDSLYVGGFVDMDCGPVSAGAYWQDDKDLAGFPSCWLPHQTLSSDRRLQDPASRAAGTPNGVSEDSSLCSNWNIRINGFSIVDDDGDLNRTIGIPTFLLVDHTIDPLQVSSTGPPMGATGPSRVGFRAFRSYTGNTPYVGGGGPRTDQQRYEFMSGAAGTNIGTLEADGEMKDGFIIQDRGEEKGDYMSWWSCGPWLNVANGGQIQVTVAFTIAEGNKELAYTFANAYKTAYDNGFAPDGGAALLATYPSLANAYAIQVAFEGIYELRSDWPWLTNGHGRETMVHPTAGQGAITSHDCRDTGDRTVTYQGLADWFDYDCNYCTGAYNSIMKLGMFHRTWNADAPPPNPNLNVGAQYNYFANPSRVVPAGDNQITLAWDNISEVTPDPKTNWLDLRGYRVWKAANWQRPVGSAGPSDNDWSLLGEFRQFHYYNLVDGVWVLSQQNYTKSSPTATDSVCPRMYVPNYNYPAGSAHCPSGCVDSATVDICLQLDDLWDRQSGQVIRAAKMGCVVDDSNKCMGAFACRLGQDARACADTINWEHRVRYPVGRYQLVDREVKNGFVYFYSVTAFDSTPTGRRGEYSMLEGRRSATESDGVSPQASVRAAKSAWVVPNPYRGYRNIAERPSSWDMTPNGSDPTGTHIDFMGLPRGKWTVKIFTVSGDWVQTLRSDDPVNESIRTPLPGPGGTTVPGYNRQQDNPNDGQARWNLISRNGQDIVSGIYLFTVESDGGTQRGKFVVIR
jgi:hypothetical protein